MLNLNLLKSKQSKLIVSHQKKLIHLYTPSLIPIPANPQLTPLWKLSRRKTAAEPTQYHLSSNNIHFQIHLVLPLSFPSFVFPLCIPPFLSSFWLLVPLNHLPPPPPFFWSPDSLSRSRLSFSRIFCLVVIIDLFFFAVTVALLSSDTSFSFLVPRRLILYNWGLSGPLGVEKDLLINTLKVLVVHESHKVQDHVAQREREKVLALMELRHVISANCEYWQKF